MKTNDSVHLGLSAMAKSDYFFICCLALSIVNVCGQLDYLPDGFQPGLSVNGEVWLDDASSLIGISMHKVFTQLKAKIQGQMVVANSHIIASHIY